MYSVKEYKIAYIFFYYIASNDKKIEIQRKKAQIDNDRNLKNIEIRPLFKEKEKIKQNNNIALIVKKQTIIDKIKEKFKFFINKVFKYNRL